MKNTVKLISSALVALIMTAFSVGCTVNISETAKAPSVVSIEKTSSEGLEDIYTITYSDGSTSFFTITNGRNGVDGKDGENAEAVSLDELYEKYLELYPSSDYAEFLKTLSPEIQTSEVSAINSALSSSAKVYAEFTENVSNYFMTTKETAVYSGSAVIFRMDEDYTYFITNFHVIYDKSALETDKIAKKITCYLYGSEGQPAGTSEKDENGCVVYNYGNYALDGEYVGGSVNSDIAIFKVETDKVKAVNSGATTAEFADGYAVGETAIAIGNPNGEGLSVTKGIVSVDNEYIQLNADGVLRAHRSIRIDTSIYHGSSGGGLFNSEGKLIGITNAGDESSQNVNYAVPLPIVKATVDAIMYYSESEGSVKAKKITLGVQVVSKNSRYVYDGESGYGKIVEDVVVDSVNPSSIIESMGIVEGDLLTEMTINGESLAISRLFNLGDALLTIRSGDEIAIKFVRDGEEGVSAVHTVTDSELSILE